MLTLNRLFVCLCMMFLIACTPKKTIIHTDRSDPTLPVDGAEATVRGQLSDGGEARGKSIAAWQGFQVGERIYELALEPNQGLNFTTLLVHASSTAPLEKWIGKQVQIEGTWQVLAPVVSDPMQPRQMPVNLDGDMEIIQPKPTLHAETVTALGAK